LTSLPIDFGDERIREYYQEYNAENGKYLTDTDGDGLMNYEEIAFESELIKFDPDLVLPTFEYCYNYLKEKGLYLGVKDGFERFFTTGTYNEIRSIRILPIKSDPLNADGDKDNFLDNSDPEPLTIINNGTDICTGLDLPAANIEILQKCLEHLKLLDMTENGSKVAYGTFGGKTKSAYQMFQISYGFDITGNDAVIDENTYQTIINVAVNNGLMLSEYTGKTGEDLYNAIIHESAGIISRNKDYFTDTYTVKPNPSEDQVKNHISVVELKNNDYFDVMYCFDYTVPLITILTKHSIETKSEFRSLNDPLGGRGNMSENYAFYSWHNKVKTGGIWDMKNSMSWSITIPNIKYFSQKFIFKFENYYMTSEDFGNFHFGYTGHALGVPLRMLIQGSAAVGIIEHAPDDENDVDNFTKGFEYYNENAG
jgi:hypothetical protein